MSSGDGPGLQNQWCGCELARWVRFPSISAIFCSLVPKMEDAPISLAEPIAIPLWILILLPFVAVWAAFDRMIMPTVRWYIRRKVNRAISEVNTRLRMTMRHFHLTKRQVLIDRLVYDPQVINATQAVTLDVATSGSVLVGIDEL